MKKSFLFISCEDAKQICDKSQYNEASAWEKLKLNLRFSWCRFTRAYVKNNKKLTQIVKDSNVNCLNSSEKEELKLRFQEASKNK